MTEMTSTRPTAVKPINVLLSRDELLYILSLINVETIPGIDPDTLGELTDGQQRIAQAVAVRALRARELAQQRNGSGTAVHNALLAAVGVCAYPQKTLFAYHWTTGAEAPIRFFGHMRDSEVIAHTRPEADLHLLSRLASPNYLVAQLLALCECNSAPTNQATEVTMPKFDFAEVRRLAEGDSPSAALDLLLEHRVPSVSAQSLINTLSSAPRVSIVQMLKQGEDQVQKQELTLVQNAQHAWLVQDKATESDQLCIKATQRAEVESIFTQWFV